MKICSSCILLLEEPPNFSILTGSDCFDCRIAESTTTSWLDPLHSPSFVLRSRYKSKVMSFRSDDGKSPLKAPQRCLVRSLYIFKRSFFKGILLQCAMKSMVRADRISAAETSDGTSGM